MVEMAMTVPVILLLLLGMLEFGFAYSHHLTLEYATREGARTGSALADGSNEIACAGVDEYVIAGVQRVLTGSGGQVQIAQVKEIHIYKADTAGAETSSSVNVWIPGVGPTVDGISLLFKRSGGTNWDACLRNNVAGNTDSIGVSLVYDYQYVTPLGNFMGLGGNPTLRISDRTIMALNPSGT
jgi:Flp pilus assembly protein TadG